MKGVLFLATMCLLAGAKVAVSPFAFRTSSTR